SLFLIGGGWFDKGPSNLRLLRTPQHFRSWGAELKSLAGNHDLRMLVGLAYAGRRETRFERLVVRMGKKTMRLFKEVYDEYFGGESPRDVMSDQEFIERFFPRESWYEEFPLAIRGSIPEPKIAKELRRIREKVEELQVAARGYGMSLGALHEVLVKCRQLFL